MGEARTIPSVGECWRHKTERGTGTVKFVADRGTELKVCLAWIRDDRREESARVIDGDLFFEQWERCDGID